MFESQLRSATVPRASATSPLRMSDAGGDDITPMDRGAFLTYTAVVSLPWLALLAKQVSKAQGPSFYVTVQPPAGRACDPSPEPRPVLFSPADARTPAPTEGGHGRSQG